MTDEIVDKFKDILKFKWCEYKDSQDTDEPELVILSTFLNKIADQCRASMSIEKSGSRNSRSAPERGSIRVHALLDEVSTVTLIDEQVANRIGMKGRRKTLHVSNECENSSLLYETDKLKKQTVILGGNESASETSSKSAPPPPPAARSETNSAFTHYRLEHE
ncbi:hypothetical protein EVAR_66421_1 [Eumeta japonica]|uniref:Uncharacterized protein n=1 Tax=Eumeta variegata TaxID=151549 RepID=A0A4C1ZX37_EUMVA|nr:hypothetical protein EVAR_66421_1 [Eumeta japonica]